jgi:hypothetical protein
MQHLTQKLHKQLKQQFQKAFDELLEQKLKEKDYEWVTRLYVEIRDKICALIPRRADVHTQIKEQMDEVIFRQMLEADAYKPEDLVNLIGYVFHWFTQLQSPARDASTEKKKQALFALLSTPGTTLASFVPVFVKTTHAVLDEIEEDKAAFRETVQKMSNQ